MKELNDLIERARGCTMTPAERWDQRVSWVYGNCGLENDRITREIAVAAVTREYGPRPDGD